MTTLKVKTLEINNTHDWQDQGAYEIAGEEVGLYGDNGGDCDGNANFPSQAYENDEIVARGLGEYHQVCYYENDIDGLTEALMARKQLSPMHFAEQRGSDSVEYDDIRDALNAAVDTIYIRWSGYDNGGTIVVEWTTK